MIFQLDDNPYIFPDPHYGEEDGLIAVGGDLSPERLATAYSHGIFPWYGFKENEDILWWCPLDRFVIFPSEIHISHSKRQMLNKGQYEVTINQAFDEVIKHCSMADQRNQQCGAWLGSDMIKAYTEMHNLGLAASVEVWEKDENANEGENENTNKIANENTNEPSTVVIVNNNIPPKSPQPNRRLVGGLYGIHLGKNFFGESMFSLAPSASKLALIHLAQLLEPYGGLIDCQFETPHLKTMGGRHISYEEYMEYLTEEDE